MKKLLIANRGEIAVRIIRAAQEMGLRTVAVYSEVDKDAIHAALADESVCIGPPEPAESYLNMAKILDAAAEMGADAVHPGYGFLSERTEFAEACETAGIIFVGPSAAAMRVLGSKIEAKQLAVSAGVPVTPGFFERGATGARLSEAANEIGYPVMLKASAGGGGRGMRIVRESDAFEGQLSVASDEALKAFGDGAMMVEKLVDRPRHIEVQVLADHYGNVACLFERECSLQRRHQKIVEEAPSVMGDALWPPLREAVESLIRASGYTNAGTVEFMLDQATDQFYFLEVNARLQVEHPVTEEITGLDLVKWQLRIASGEKLDLSNSHLKGRREGINGHAIEARIVAEDPAQDFRPSIGKMLAWAEPKRPGIRVESGYGAGSEISRHYDSLMAKVIAHAETRDEAIEKLTSALLDFHILGVRTNISFLLAILAHPLFRAGEIDTGFIGREFGDWKGDVDLPIELGTLVQGAAGQVPFDVVSTDGSAWSAADGFRN